MLDERTAATDPLRFIDPRYEPRDPLFDCEEPLVPKPCRKRRTAAAALAALAGTLACGGSRPTTLHATDAILVRLAPGATPPERAPAHDGEAPIVGLNDVSSEDGLLLRVPLEPGTDAVLAAAQYARKPGVELAEPIYLYRAARAANDPRTRDQWALAKLSAPEVWSRTTGDARVVVAVIDDGMPLDHPDLLPNLWTNPGETAGDGLDNDGDGIIDDVHGASFQDGDETGDPTPIEDAQAAFHGSHVAGIIGAAGDNHIGIAGLSWRVSLMPLRALGPLGGRSDDLAKAIDYAVDHGARIINLSWAGPGTSRVLASAIERAGENGVLVVAAAGNDSADAPRFPASLELPNLLSVGASDFSDALATFSNRGALLAAPGVGILSTTAAGSYSRYDGTSMASAQVSGVAALLFAAHPEATVEQVRRALTSSAVQIEGVQGGRIDAVRALLALDAQEREAPGALVLSKESLQFSPGGPRSQPVSVRVEGGGARNWSARSSAAWLSVAMDQGQTPARVSVRVLAGAPLTGSGAIVFTDELGSQATLTVTVGPRKLTIAGEGCAMRGDGKLHALAGAGCVLESDAGRWTLPGGQQIRGAKLAAHFIRPGEYRLALDSGDPLPVVIE